MLAKVNAKIKACHQKHLYSEETGNMLNFLTLEIKNKEVQANLKKY